jgi:hypothetical protein
LLYLLADKARDLRHLVRTHRTEDPRKSLPLGFEFGRSGVADGKVRLYKPVVDQTVAGGQALVSARYSFTRDGEVRFDIADYDHIEALGD